MWVVSSPPALLQEIPLSPTLNKFSSIRTRKALEEELGLSAGDAKAVKRRTSTSKTTAATQSCTNWPTHAQPLCLTAPQTPLPNGSPALSALVVPANLAHSPTIIHFPAPSSVHPTSRPGKGNPSPHCKRHNVNVENPHIMHVLGWKCACIFMVRYRRAAGTSHPNQVSTMKSIKRKHVLSHKELQHKLPEQSIFQRVADEPESHPLILPR
ncbi:hypothetical protein PtA15_2A306 [Puccinia triticina]|nr:uncharacterized protein PtA15_2A306 [Puccinia triticina]WAQ81993.1 hypothetical protein PtA15_2A306 [Puccinia triticina]